MGWSGGTEVFLGVVAAAKKAIPDMDARVRFYIECIEAFEEHDWDTQEEILGEDPAYDAAWEEVSRRR